MTGKRATTLGAGAVGLLWCLAAAGAAEVPSQVKGINAFHRAGQTFITFKEVDPLVTAEKVTWGEIKEKFTEAEDAVRYRVYAHDKPITAGSIAAAELLGEVGPLSGCNLNGRNTEYLIAQAMIKPDKIGELTIGYNGFIYRWHMNHRRMDRYPIDRFVIDAKAGPLKPGTGLFVAHPKKAGKRYYAVVSCRAGKANTKDFSPGNALTRPLAETAGSGEPVCQGDGLWGPYFDYPGRRKVYVQWAAPPLSPRPMYFNWSVLVPPGVKKAAPVELYFHGGSYTYAKPNAKFMAGSIQIAPHDYPFSGWYGYHEAFGGPKPLSAGKVRNHTQRRVIAFLDWAQKKFAIDPDRIIPVGGDGAAMIALSYPERFAYVLITGFEARLLNRRAAGQYKAAWGPKDPKITDEQGRGEWAWGELDKVVLATRGKDLPLFVCKGGSWGRVKGWGKGRGLFYSAMHQAGQPLYAHWAWGGNLAPPNRYTQLWRGLDIRRTTPVPAFANSSLDKEGEGHGHTNTAYAWKDIKDLPDSFQITITGRASTVDLTSRRLSKFKLKAGETVNWEAVTLPGRRGETAPAQGGQTIADAQALVKLEKLKLAGGGLVVKLTRAK